MDMQSCIEVYNSLGNHRTPGTPPPSAAGIEGAPPPAPAPAPPGGGRRGERGMAISSPSPWPPKSLSCFVLAVILIAAVVVRDDRPRRESSSSFWTAPSRLMGPPADTPAAPITRTPPISFGTPERRGRYGVERRAVVRRRRADRVDDPRAPTTRHDPSDLSTRRGRRPSCRAPSPSRKTAG